MDGLETDLGGAGVEVLPDAGADGRLVAPHDHGVQEAGIAAVLQVSNFRCERREGSDTAMNELSFWGKAQPLDPDRGPQWAPIAIPFS